MKFQTSTNVSSEDIARIEKNLRRAAQESKNEKFFKDGEKIELEVGSQYSSVDDLAKKAKEEVKPAGNPTACAIAYEIAKAACGGDATCLAIAHAAYLLCLNS